jgi:hypothetical protein
MTSIPERLLSFDRAAAFLPIGRAADRTSYAASVPSRPVR